MKFMLAFVGVLALVQQGLGKATNAPEQVHLSLGTDETEMVITWATLHHISDDAHVEFGVSKDALKSHVKAEVTHFHDGASLYTYRALLTGLQANTVYYYRVGSAGSAWSQVFHFKTLPHGEKWNPRLALYGDLGYQNEVSLPYLSKDVEKDLYDVIFHIGDFAYDLHEEHGKRGNDFMNSIEKVAAKVPYMACAGNHEHHNNFSHYDARFTMLDRTAHGSHLSHRINNHFHSMDIGPVHVIMYSTEFYYYTQYGTEQIKRQFHFLEEDLKKANANRAQRPWIIAMGHRPIYCLKMGDHSCNHETLEREAIRKGLHSDKGYLYSLENLFHQYGVDILLFGHDHFYSRLLPIYNFTIKGGSHDNPYHNAHAPLHIVTGSAGNREHHAKFSPLVERSPWVAAHHYDYGYTRLTFVDRNHIVLEQVSDDKHGQVIDKIDITKSTDHPKWML